VILDERSAAFTALGMAKASARPAVLICTSGSAPAHYFPAVIEAAHAAIPLIVLSADRPPELRHCHAGQTIDQQHLFGSHVRFFAELPVPNSNATAPHLRESARRAVQAALGLPAGPVHLNVPFPEPLLPAATDASTALALPHAEPGGRLSPLQVSVSAPVQLPARLLILSGALPGLFPEEDMARIHAMSANGIPVLADASSPLRSQAGHLPSLIRHYDLILRSISDDALLPDGILCYGEPPLSKVLRSWIAQHDISGWQCGPGKVGINPAQANWNYIGSHLPETVAAPPVATAFAAAWQAAESSAARQMEARFASAHPLFEGDILRALPAMLEQGAPLFLANSLTVRAAEWFQGASDKRLRVFSQRGANGIDGNVSVARGIAAALRSPAVMVAGDLAVLHDSNGLLGAAADPFGLFIILLNNQGGGIFELLPAAETARFEQLFATPQTINFQALAEAHGCGYARADSVQALADNYTSWNRRGLHIVEIPINRSSSAALHRQFLQPIESVAS
jgi:2-succinyl-5-enolpyruvyl-6-hydroxy-3-cyclohexene-1-carboxylate synthase